MSQRAEDALHHAVDSTESTRSTGDGGRFKGRRVGVSGRIEDGIAPHLIVGIAVCLFVVSPALFTPWGFGPDYTNHLWLVWQQGIAISHHGHPTLYLQAPGGIFEPLFGFYGGTLYSLVGAFSAAIGNHAYEAYLASIAAAAAIAYGGMWWICRLLGLGRWMSHLPAFVLVTAAYYLTDIYARGAWTEVVALSAVPMFIAAAVSLLTRQWRAGPVALFVLAIVLLTGSHNITLFWSVIVLGPVAVLTWIIAGSSRPSWRWIVAVACLGALAVGINAWFLFFDLLHNGSTLVGAHPGFAWEFTKAFDTLGVILDPLRQTPVQSGTPGLAIATPVAAFALGLAVLCLVGRASRSQGRPLQALWFILLAVEAVLVWMMVMPASWWARLGSPFILIQFPYRLAGWLLVAVVVQLAVALRLARGLDGHRRKVAIFLGAVLVVATIVQASSQMYSATRLDGEAFGSTHIHELAYANGPTAPPATYYDPHSYADGSLPLIETSPKRSISLPTPSPGQTRLVVPVKMPGGSGPVATNIAAGPFAARLEGAEVLGRDAAGMLVLRPPAGESRTTQLSLTADAGGIQPVAVICSVVCLLVCLGLVTLLLVKPSAATWSLPKTTGRS